MLRSLGLDYTLLVVFSVVAILIIIEAMIEEVFDIPDMRIYEEDVLLHINIGVDGWV